MKILGAHSTRHDARAAGLARGEIRDSDTGATLDVVGVTQDERGVLVEIVTQWTVGLTCLDYLVVVTNADSGEVIGSKRVEVSDTGLFSLTSMCEHRTRVRVNASADTRVRVQMWQANGNDVQDVEAGTAIGYAAESRPFYLDEAPSTGESSGSSTIEDSIADASTAVVGGLVGPILTYGTLALGLYVAIVNRNHLAAAVGDLIGSEGDTTNEEPL